MNATSDPVPATLLDDSPAREALELLRERLPEAEGEALGIAELLGAFNPDAESVAAALLLPLHAAGRLEALPESLAGGVAVLLEGVARMDLIEELHRRGGSEEREDLRKMLLAMVADLRVVFLKLAERLWRTRRLKHAASEERRHVARLNLDVFAPLANRLGLGQVKWELEDLSLHALEPDTYLEIARLLDEKRTAREAYIQQVKTLLKEELARRGIEADIAGRPKHIYSIWKKMHRKGVDFHQLFDVRAVRVLVESVEQCYAVLSLAHELWEPVPGEFDDYVANPKANGYRSLHTAVHGPEGRPLEVQIRTFGMHRESEMGVAAHWRYKEGGRRDASLERKVAWLRQLLERHGEAGDPGEQDDLAAQLHTQELEDRVYVFSPKGRVFDLPLGATPLDFAYAIHTQVGHRCRGARINGRIAPLHTPLQTGDQVEVLTAKSGEPSRDWIDDPKYLATHRAREKVRLWFRERDFDRHLAAGRETLERELNRLGAGQMNQEQLGRELGFEKSDKLLAAIGRGEVSAAQIAGAVRRLAPAPAAEAPPTVSPRRRAQEAPRPGEVRIEGVDNLLFQLANCCNPVPGDAIGGYLTQGHGVSIHRHDCPNFERLRREQPERYLEVDWSGAGEGRYTAEVAIAAHDRRGLLRDITNVFGDLKINVVDMRSTTDRRSGEVHTRCTLQLRDNVQLSHALDRLKGLPDVREARRA